MPTRKVHFACDGCGKRYHAPAEAVGQSTRCKQCGEAVTVPEPPQAELIGFDCRLCHTRLHAPSTDVGQRLRCPDCHVETVIPPPPPPVVKRRPAAMEGEQYELYEGEDQPHGADLARAETPSLKFSCRVCLTVMRVQVDQANQAIPCPDCGVETRAPEAPTEQPSPKPVRDETPRKTEPPESLFEYYSARPRAGYRRDESNKERTSDRLGSPTPTRWMLLTDQFAYARSPGFVSIALALALAATLAAVAGGAALAAAFGWRVGVTVGLDVLLPLMAISFFTVAFTFMGFAAFASAVLQQAADGAPRVHTWASTMPADWFADGFRWLVGLGSAAALGGALASGLGLEGVERAAVVGGVAWFAAPWVLLSQLDIGSPWGVFSPRLLRTLWRTPGSWFLFYAQTALGLATLGAAAVALARFVAPAAIVALAPFALLGALHSTWMLGRLAWAIAHATDTGVER